MQDAQLYWSIFLETGAPEAYLSYKNAISGKQVTEQPAPENHRHGTDAKARTALS